MSAGTGHAIVLFAHGARDARWGHPLERLRSVLAQRQPGVPVQAAFLERMEPRLEPALAALAAAGVRSIAIAPVFWSAGGHVTGDLPAMVARFRAAHPGVRIDVLPVLSELPGMSEFLAEAILAQAGGTP
jgi:sirohydrochlorin cobaltochelatase